MYLISLYFDEGTNKKIQLYMEQIAQRTGNMAMIDGKVPPHITLSAFDMAEEEKAIAGFTAMEQEFEKGQIFWCSVGMFLPYQMTTRNMWRNLSVNHRHIARSLRNLFHI